MKNLVKMMTGLVVLAAVHSPAADVPAPGPGPEMRPGPPMGMPMMEEDREITGQFDKNGDGWLNREEREAARAFLKENPTPRRGPPGGRPGGFGGERETKEPVAGAHISPADVKAESAGLYDGKTLRTLFIDFENANWEKELEEFHGTDVDVPAALTADGKTYPGVGVHFRGMSSYMMVSAGNKRSLNVSLDLTEKKQRLDGYKSLNLLNAHEDGSFMSSALYSEIARKHLPAPKANFVRVVINGENWGVYVNQQQFNKDFIQENYRTGKGARWKVRGSPMGQGGLDYAGEDLGEYKRRYTMKDGKDEDWKALVKLCKTLSETPAEGLQAALEPMLDIEGALWFLALDCALMNGDGYWIRASDYTIYRDKGGKFHVIPGDMNEAFRGVGGPGGPFGGRPGGQGFPGGPQGIPGGPQGQSGPDGLPGGRPGMPFPGMPTMPKVDGVKLDPLTGLDDAKKPLRSKLLAVPALRASYLAKVRTIAEEDLDWKNLGPVVAGYRAVIEKELAADTRKLSTMEEFETLTADQAVEAATGEVGRRELGRNGMPLRKFADERRAYLMEKTEAR